MLNGWVWEQIDCVYFDLAGGIEADFKDRISKINSQLVTPVICECNAPIYVWTFSIKIKSRMNE